MSQRPPDTAGQPALRASRLFAEFLSRRDGGEELDFEDFCLAHPEAERELRILDGHWERVVAVLDHLGVSGSRSRMTTGVPALGEAKGTPTGTRAGSEVPSIEVLRRLSHRGHSSSRYSIQGEVARGGMGAILRVYDEDLRRTLAMKVVLSQEGPRARAAKSPDESRVLGRFLEEAQVTSQLEHPGIVPVHELGLDQQGRVFFTMRLVSGRDLERIFALVQSSEEGWTPTRAVGVVLKICEAMAYAHDKGVIHRDLKPANVMVGRFGEVYVMDWGLARVLGREDTKDIRPRAPQETADDVSTDRLDARRAESVSALHTMDGDIVGTPAYMSPEQARGDLTAMGPASDVYSTGAILYHLLAGHMPYVPAAPGSNSGPEPNAIDVWQKVRAGSPEPIPERNPAAPLELVAICDKAMARELDRRYAGMQELADDLRAYLEGRVVRAYETGALAEFKKWVARNKALAWTTLIAVFVTMAGSVTAGIVLGRKNVALAKANLESRANEQRALDNEQIAKQSTAIAEERAARILRLSDVKRLQELSTQAESLWPAHPENIGALEGWLSEARELAKRLTEHRASLADLRQRALPSTDPATEPTWTFASPEERWQHDTQQELVAGLETFGDPDSGRIAEVERRLEFARTIEARTISGPDARALWAEAVRSIADPRESPKYGGLEIRPRIGLLPLGRDPQSGLWEFAHLQTGEPPLRDPSTGELRLTESSGLVFVLIPAGTFDMGAQRTDPGAPNFDPEAEDNEEPVGPVTLAPFLLSKYELTQGQWLRSTGRNPSIYPAGSEYDGKLTTLLHPVEQVSWNECAEELHKLALALPTEAQWEYAARAGTSTPWWTGADMTLLEGTCNVADRAAKRVGANWPGIDDWPELDDEYAVHAPVDHYRPNPFGLHNMLGNVWEWCRDAYVGYGLDTSAEDGERLATDSLYRVSRGGAYYQPATFARCANRNNSPPDTRSNHLGVRPLAR